MINKTDERFAIEAILSINPKSAFSVSGTYESLIWHSKDINKPTKSQFDDALAVIKSNWKASQYQRDRAAAFPSWQEQMDMQYWDAKNGTTTWQDAIEAVKTKYPKGE